MHTEHADYLQLHRIPTKPSKYLVFGQFFANIIALIAVLVCALSWPFKLLIILILLAYCCFLWRNFKSETMIAQDRYLLLNDKDEWQLSSGSNTTQTLVLQSHVLILPFLLLLPFRGEKQSYTFIYLTDNLPKELTRVLRVRLLHPLTSKHPLQRNK